MDVTVPPNAAGVVYVPGSDPSSVTVGDAADAKYIGKRGNRLVYEVDSGSYHFAVRAN